MHVMDYVHLIDFVGHVHNGDLHFKTMCTVCNGKIYV